MLDLIEIRRHLHQIPEIGMSEFETQKYLLKVIEDLTAGKDFVELKTWQTAILVLVHGSAADKTIGWRTDIDALPIIEATGLPFASNNGAMHACGHDFHMSISLGLLEKALESQPKNNLLFLFQPAEETVSGAQKMYDAGVFEGDYRPDIFYGLHVNAQRKVGEIATNKRTLMASACEVNITFKGSGGHAAFPHLVKDPIVAAAYFITQAQTIVSRNTDPLDSAVISFGEFHAGSTDAIIPDTAYVRGTMRALTQSTNLMTQKRITEIAKSVAASFDMEVDVDLDQMGYLPVENNPELAGELMNFLEAEEGVTLIDCLPEMTGEDFGYLLNKIPGVMMLLGVDSPAPLHSAKMTPHEEAIPFAVEKLSKFLLMKAAQ